MIIVSEKIVRPYRDKPEMREILMEHEGVRFKTGCSLDVSAANHVNQNQALLLERYYELAIKRESKSIQAPDFLVASPKIDPDNKIALKEAKDEALKDSKSIAKLALTLPRLIAYVEELELRLVKLEKLR